MSTPTGSSSSRQVSEADNRREDPMDTSDLARPLPQSSSPVPPSGNLKANHSFHFFAFFITFQIVLIMKYRHLKSLYFIIVYYSFTISLSTISQKIFVMPHLKLKMPPY